MESVDHILYKNRMDVIVKEDIYHLCKKSENHTYTYTYDYEIRDNACEGKIKVYLNDELIQEGDVTTKEPVERKNFWELILCVVRECFV